MLEVAEHAARLNDFKYLFVERTLSFMDQMVNRKGRDRRVEPAHRRKLVVEVMIDNCDAAIVPKLLPHGIQHRGEKSSATNSALGRVALTRVTSLPAPVPRSRIL